jgi:hypothetical protein
MTICVFASIMLAVFVFERAVRLLIGIN